MGKARIIIGLCVVAVLGAGGYFWMRGSRQHSAAQEELKAQEPEVKQCKERLALFYKAWSDYQKDHNGASPGSIEALIPKYIRDPNLFVCPTAQRWTKKGALMHQGGIIMDRRQYVVTYGFRGLASGFTRSVKLNGDKAPLIICEAHEEGLYRAAYKKPPPPDAFDEDPRAKLIPEVRDSRMLAVLKNGAVEPLEPGHEN